MNKNKGFTLIELLVVIAIIGILSSVVLASLNTARNKGADAAIKSNLANTRAQGELVYDTIETPDVAGYTNVCANTTVAAAVSAAMLASGISGAASTRCVSNATQWAAWVELKTVPASAWCVDNSGASKLLAVKPASPSTITACP